MQPANQAHRIRHTAEACRTGRAQAATDEGSGNLVAVAVCYGRGRYRCSGWSRFELLQLRQLERKTNVHIFPNLDVENGVGNKERYLSMMMGAEPIRACMVQQRWMSCTRRTIYRWR